MFGILSQQSNKFVLPPIDQDFSSGDPYGFLGSGGGNAGVATSFSAPSNLVGENKPTQQFDINALAGLSPSAQYLGKNRVSDIREAYQTYITGNPVGRGGQYAIDAARRYGTTITEAARGYLVTVGLPTLANVLPATPDTPAPAPTETPTPVETVTPKNPFELLVDALPKLFGNAVYNPPLQTQATGYTPFSTSEQVGSGSNFGLFIILAIVGIVGYFLYKKFAS